MMPTTAGVQTRGSYREVSIDVAEEDWEWAGSDDMPKSRLLGPPVWVNGELHHMEAVQVYGRSDDGYTSYQVAADPTFESTIEGMYLCDSNGAFNTVEIFGYDYVVNILPGK